MKYTHYHFLFYYVSPHFQLTLPNAPVTYGRFLVQTGIPWKYKIIRRKTVLWESWTQSHSEVLPQIPLIIQRVLGNNKGKTNYRIYDLRIDLKRIRKMGPCCWEKPNCLPPNPDESPIKFVFEYLLDILNK